VSNHGGRQLNAAPVSIHSLTQIRQAVGHDMPLIFDSGIRSGEHVIKAIALGADFVMLGRLVMFGLGSGGATGLSNILDVIADEASAVMGLIGQTQVSDIDEYCLASSHGYLSSQDMQRSVAE
jgi:L-lactate dehydrogenase (cytochrome)